MAKGKKQGAPSRAEQVEETVIGGAEETLPPTIAGEQHRPEGLRSQLLGVEQELQIFAGGRRVADMELDRVTGVAHLPRDDAPSFLVVAEHGAHEKIAPPEMTLVLVDDGADEQALLEQFLVLVGHLRAQVSEHVDRGLTAQFENQVLLGFGDQKRLAERTATLADDEVGLDVTRDRHAYAALGDDVAIADQSVVAGLARP